MAYDFGSVLVFAVVGVLFVFLILLISALVRPKFPNSVKREIYECGEKTIGSAWFNFNPRFYVVALIFVIFEVEIALMLPVVMVYNQFVNQGVGALAFIEIVTFLFILTIGLVWVWAKGDLDFIKRLPGKSEPGAEGR